MTDTWPPADEFDVTSDEVAPDPDDRADNSTNDESLLDRMRGTGVGVEDPNIVGDVGPTDVPPGRDTPDDGLFADPPSAL
ncbi:MAG: hypothetical protein M3159_03330 [Actinomycetota bacterium]|nr:hypothetical protein [Actinomycetota bacterium]